MTDVHIHLHIHPSEADAHRLDLIDRKVTAVLEGQVQLMTQFDLAKQTLDQLNTVTNTIAAAVTDVIVADQKEDDDFRAEIAALKQQVVDGKAVTEQQLEELTQGMGGTSATLQAVADSLKAIGSTPSDPLPTPEIPPVEPPVEPAPSDEANS